MVAWWIIRSSKFEIDPQKIKVRPINIFKRVELKKDLVNNQKTVRTTGMVKIRVTIFGSGKLKAMPWFTKGFHPNKLKAKLFDVNVYNDKYFIV